MKFAAKTTLAYLCLSSVTLIISTLVKQPPSLWTIAIIATASLVSGYAFSRSNNENLK